MKITPEIVAKECHWDGERVFAVMVDALTESNFHELRNRLESTFAGWLYEQQIKEREAQKLRNLNKALFLNDGVLNHD